MDIIVERSKYIRIAKKTDIYIENTILLKEIQGIIRYNHLKERKKENGKTYKNKLA